MPTSSSSSSSDAGGSSWPSVSGWFDAVTGALCASGGSASVSQHVGDTTRDNKAPMTNTEDDSASKALPMATSVDSDAEIALIGDAFPGSGKYLGGELGDDGRVYAVPGHAKRVLRIDPSNQTVELVGPVFEGKYKWLRAARGTDGALYGIPCHASRVLRIAPGVEPEISLVGPEFSGEWKWHGGVKGADDAIYAIPQSATRVLRIRCDPLRIDLVGPEFPGRWKWYGGLRAFPGDVIYGIPACADTVLRIDTSSRRGRHEKEDEEEEDAASHRDDDDNNSTPSISTVGELAPGGWKWHGGVVTPDGTVYGAPSNANEVLKIKNDVVTTVGAGKIRGGHHRDDDKYKFLGMVVANDGCCFCVPSDADYVLKIDPATDEVSNFGRSLAFLAKGQSRGQNKWQNGACLNDGKIYAIPLKAEVVLRVDPATGDVDTLPHPARGLNLWEGGVVGPDGGLYCMPLKCDRVLRIAPASTPATDAAAAVAPPVADRQSAGLGQAVDDDDDGLPSGRRAADDTSSVTDPKGTSSQDTSSPICHDGPVRDLPGVCAGGA